ncbi:MAG: hydrolase [Gammaproteobacteria bacterium]|nr:hydrolase [Gammaproteobacteria bacterium]
MTTPWLIDASLSQFLIIDVQTRLGKAMPQQPHSQLLNNLAVLCQAAQQLHVPIHYTEQYPNGLGHTEAEIELYLKDILATEKTGFSCCSAEGFLNRLKNTTRKQIVISGMESHVCVLQTVMQLLDEQFQVYVVADAIVSRNKQHHKNALSRMQQAGAIITNYESVIFEWLRDATHPEFKSLSKLIR